jgi:hypothetical protein
MATLLLVGSRYHQVALLAYQVCLLEFSTSCLLVHDGLKYRVDSKIYRVCLR